MEIYRLKDEVPEGRKKQNGDGSRLGGFDNGGDFVENEKLVITGLKVGVKNPNRVNVFVNSRFAFSLDVAQVVEFKLKVGMELSDEKLAEIRKASEFGKLYQRALEWVLMRPRSVLELKDYLRRRERIAEMKEKQCEWMMGKEGKKVREHKRIQYDFDDLIVKRLRERGYVDDRKFAEYYVENRFVKKGVSRKRLEMELVKKGVAREIIGEVLEGRDDAEEVRKMIAKKRDKYESDEKLIAYLCRQGFSYDLVRELVLDRGNN